MYFTYFKEKIICYDSICKCEDSKFLPTHPLQTSRVCIIVFKCCYCFLKCHLAIWAIPKRLVHPFHFYLLGTNIVSHSVCVCVCLYLLFFFIQLISWIFSKHLLCATHSASTCQNAYAWCYMSLTPKWERHTAFVSPTYRILEAGNWSPVPSSISCNGGGSPFAPGLEFRSTKLPYSPFPLRWH